jgi:hypothetical protein
MSKKIIWVRFQREIDTDPDLSYLGKYTSKHEEGAIDRQERGDMGRNEYRYFVPAMTGEETGNPDSPEQDYQRAEDYNKQGWCMMGVFAAAKIEVNGVCSIIRSGGLWGIESDSEESYFQEVEQEEFAQLEGQLQELGFENVPSPETAKA